MALIDRILNLGWDPDQHSIVIMRKVRMMAMMSLLLIGICIPFWLRAIEWDVDLRQVTVPFAMVTALTTCWLLYRIREEHILFRTSQWLCTGLLVLVMGGVITGGGSGAVSQGGLLLLPLLAGVVNGRRNAMVWGGIGLALTIAIGLVEFAGVEFHNQTPPEFRKSQSLLQGVGQMLAVLGIISGFFSQLLHSETLLARQNDVLQDQVRQTLRAMQEATAADRAKTVFLANMSHELRTPLNAIVGFSRRLEKNLQTRLSERESESLLAIQCSGVAMLQLVEDLFDLAALDSADLKLNLGPVELQQLMESIRYKLGGAESLGQDQLQVAAPATLVLHADARRFEQSLLTLLRFCLSLSGGGAVQLQATVRDACTAEIQLHASGKPDLPGWQERLFDRYNHLHSWREMQSHVSGLSLVLASELIRAQQGSVVCTESDHGLMVVIRMPRLQR